MKILIVGSEGFIGNHCIDYFLKEHEVIGIDLYPQPSKVYKYIKVSRLSSEFEDIFRTYQIDVVINAAGSANVPYSMSHPLSDFEANCLDTVRILDTIRIHQNNCIYIHLSSAAVYGEPIKLPIIEFDSTIPLSAYGWHKIAAEKLCQEYSLVFGVKTAILRPFSVYGPGLKKQMFWDLYHKIKLNVNKIEILGTGKESRDYIYVSDLVLAIDCIIKNGSFNAEIYNVASGEETYIETVVEIFFSALGVFPDYTFNGLNRKGDPLNWKADISKISSIGYKPNVKIENGMVELSKWLKQY